MKRILLALIFLLPAWACAETPPMLLDVNAVDAPHHILHAHLRIPATAGKFTLVYPKWIPGEHGPTGPITNLTGIQISAADKVLDWQRDQVDMYAFQIDVPAGASIVDVWLDFLIAPGNLSSGNSATEKIVDINWNQVLLYPQGASPSLVKVATTLHLPPSWKFGTALQVGSQTSDAIDFSPVTLETLIDSPLISGEYFRTVDLAPKVQPPHYLHIVADSADALKITPEDVANFSHLVTETGAMFGARHYKSYHFLLTLSDHVDHFGLEHHESSDDRTDEKFLIDPDRRTMVAGLLPHEMVHSWNGKYRRPADLATSDYQQPMHTDLLWVYEGLTEYLGRTLTVRSGLWNEDQYCQAIAMDAAALDQEPGRTWRPLEDTAVAAQFLYGAPREGAPWRRGVDFYSEGVLIWLEADALIRNQTHGQKSLDDFCKKFHGGDSGPPKVVPYTYDDVVKTLNDVCPYDWNQFFQSRIYAIAPHAPLGGIEACGWKLAFTDKPSDLLKTIQGVRKFSDLRFSIGISTNEEGKIVTLITGSPADKAGLSTGMKLDAVNTRRWTNDGLKAAIKAAKADPHPIELIVENDDYFKTIELNYHDGEKYPSLVRDESKPDLLAEILKANTPAPTTAEK